MNPPNPPIFLDVPLLLEASQPRARRGWFWYAAGGFAVVVIGSAILRSQSGALGQLVSVFSGMVMAGIVGALVLFTLAAVRHMRAEQRALEAAEELVQLRRWPEAAMTVQALLSRPTRTPQARVQGLIYLCSVLARYNRFSDAIAVQEHLLSNMNLDPTTARALRLGRAMSMLREDRLVDADRAINELRRLARADAGESGPDAATIESAGLALVEMYRDVKTGHPDEAVEIFTRSLSAFRRQLGHRCADAWALVAQAYERLGRSDDARRAAQNATILSSADELSRRYPEVAVVLRNYPAIQLPQQLQPQVRAA